MSDLAEEMRIALLCGSLEPGRDGVGDYTSALAGELRRRGADVSLVALADRHIAGGVLRGAGTLRIPANLGWDAARSHLAQVLESAEPTVLSLQYVPWSFAPRGVAPVLGRWLKDVAGQRHPWHVMFHELWMESGGPLRHRVLAGLQRRAMLKTLDDLQPSRVHVSVTPYRERLASTGWPATILPLFGAIPIKTGATAGSDGRRLRVVFFGTPPPAHERSVYVEGVRSLGQARPVTVVLLGGADSARAGFANDLAVGMAGSSVVIEDAGFLDPEQVSAVLSGSDVGVVRNAGPLIGKSSAMLALLEHGLPVWAPLWAGEALDLPFRAELVFSQLRDAANATRLPPGSFLPTVADQFLDDLRGLGT